MSKLKCMAHRAYRPDNECQRCGEHLFPAFTSAPAGQYDGAAGLRLSLTPGYGEYTDGRHVLEWSFYLCTDCMDKLVEFLNIDVECERDDFEGVTTEEDEE